MLFEQSCTKQTTVPSPLKRSNQLSSIRSLEQHRPRLGHILKLRRHHRLRLRTNLNLPLLNLSNHLHDPSPSFSLRQSIHNNEPPNLNPIRNNLIPILNPHIARLVIRCNRTTSRNSPKALHTLEHEIENLSTDIIKVNIHEPVGRFDEVLGKRCGFVVNALIRTYTLHPLTLLGSTPQSQ